jgi:hypothetical protein
MLKGVRLTFRDLYREIEKLAGPHSRSGSIPRKDAEKQNHSTSVAGVVSTVWMRQGRSLALRFCDSGALMVFVGLTDSGCRNIGIGAEITAAGSMKGSSLSHSACN